MSPGQFSRRQFLVTTGGAIVAGMGAALLPQRPPGGATSHALAQDARQPVGTRGTLFIPPVLGPTEQGSGQVLALTMAPGQTEILPGTQTSTYGFNGSYLGPTLRVMSGGQVQLAVTNNLGEPTTVHWHGMHLPAEMDGGPHQVIADGETWRPGWQVT